VNKKPKATKTSGINENTTFTGRVHASIPGTAKKHVMLTIL